MEIKQSNWFAAGHEVQQALLLLSDGAFRLYFYICLNASRRTGRISISYQELALSIGRSRRSIGSHFEELRRLEICRISQQPTSTIVQKSRFATPIGRTPNSLQGVSPQNIHNTFFALKTFSQFESAFKPPSSGADEKLAGDLFARRCAH